METADTHLLDEIVQCIPKCYWACFPAKTYQEILARKTALDHAMLIRLTPTDTRYMVQA